MKADCNKAVKVKIKKGITTALGVTICESGVNFAIALEAEISCLLDIYLQGAEKPYIQVDLKKYIKVGNIYSVFIENLKEGEWEYCYVLDGKRYLDDYAKKITGREKWGEVTNQNKARCSFSLEEYDWENDKPLQIPYHEIVIYALHVRGFTKHPDSKVKQKGTFEGIIEKIPYLKELGINQIELMPAYEFDEIISNQVNQIEYASFDPNLQERINYWGYTKANYFAPKASYAAEKDCIKSFKNMVKELHRNQIEIIMEFYFEKGTNPNLIIDCIKYWVEEYHIDGVHLNSNQSPITVLARMPFLRHIKIMTEGFDWDAIYPEKKAVMQKNLAEYNDGFLIDARRFLKGDVEQLNEITARMRKNPKQCAVINYIAGHNGFNLMDMVSYEEKHNKGNGENNKDGPECNYSWNCGVEGKTRKKAVLELRKRQIKNAFVLLFLSQGVPMIYSGDEFGHTQGGNNNPYCQDNDTTWINWENKKKNIEIFEFTKKLIRFRKQNPIIHSCTELKIMDYLLCGYPDLSYHGDKAWHPEFEKGSKQIGIMYSGIYSNGIKKQKDNFIYIAYNMNGQETDFVLPNLPVNKKWRILLDTSTDNFLKSVAVQESIKIKERSITVLMGE